MVLWLPPWAGQWPCPMCRTGGFGWVCPSEGAGGSHGFQNWKQKLHLGFSMPIPGSVVAAHTQSIQNEVLDQQAGRSCAQGSWPVQSPGCRSRAPGVRFEFWEWSRDYPWNISSLKSCLGSGWGGRGLSPSLMDPDFCWGFSDP